MATNTKTIDLTGGQLQESIVGVVSSTVDPGQTHGIRDVSSSINTSLTDSSKSTKVAISTKTTSSTRKSTSTSQSINNATWDGAAPYMRSRDLYIKATGMMGDRLHFPFMENVAINEFCTSITRFYLDNVNTFETGDLVDIVDSADAIVGTAILLDFVKFYDEAIAYVDILSGTASITDKIVLNDNSADIIAIQAGNVANPALVTDKWGQLVFDYTIPPGTFTTGDRTIRLSDVNDPFVTPIRSSASGNYLAEGTIHYKQKQITNKVVTTVTRTVTNTTNKVTTNNIVNTLNRVIATNIHYNDPLAQTFIIDDSLNPNGIFVSSIDIFFKNKPATPIPLTVQLRNVVNGMPVSFEYLYNGQAKILPSDVTLSNDGSSPTNVRFTNPVYLIPGEYAIVLISNSDDYEVFIATQGSKQIGTDIVISQTPSLGVLLKSSNASTWTPMQESDLKFVINRAVFDSSGTVQFDVNAKSTSFIGDTTNGNPYITNIEFTNTNNTLIDLYLDFIITGTGIPTDAKIIEIDQLNNKIKLDQNATATASNVALTCHEVFDYSMLSFNAGIETPSGTETSWKYRVLDKNTNIQNEYLSQILGEAKDFKATQRMIASTLNSGKIPIRVTGTLTTSDDRLSPIIDIGSAYGKITKNIINNDSDFETTPIGGHADVVYFTRRIPLADGFDASNLMVIFDANQPATTSIKVYYKVSAVDSSASFESNDWVEMIQSNSQSPAINDTEFKEFKFVPPDSIASFGIPIDDPINPRFNMFAIKLVLLSSDTAYTPRIRNLRGIALDS